MMFLSHLQCVWVMITFLQQKENMNSGHGQKSASDVLHVLFCVVNGHKYNIVDGK